jgi:threonine/homoserine/homoserine lactone efflux protein
MLGSLLLGAGFAFAAAVQPGPLTAFLLAKVAERGWKATLPAALAPVVSDGPIALLVLLLLRTLDTSVRRGLQAAGGLFLLYLAWSTLRQLRRDAVREEASRPSAPRTLLQAATINILNPAPYLGWSLVLGPAAVQAWQRAPASAVVLVGAFYGTMVISLMVLIFFFGASRFLGPRGQRVLALLSGLALAGLGAYQLTRSWTG